jgi:Family of unknown function (DUF6519)
VYAGGDQAAVDPRQLREDVMRGDFSAWNKDRSHNFRGTLHQQGRVLLDRDWNAQTEIFGEWQETAARDAFGAGVAAVPAEEPQSFKVTQAEVTGGKVKVSLNKGRVWADGLLVELDADVVRTATYLEPPVQSPAGLVTDLPNNLRDAVILETWLEELSPFQSPNLLIEPALGGVDTTERVQTACRFRLYRMAAGDSCASIIDTLKDDFSAKGKLKVELIPTTVIDGDCPVVQSGGFTGFEHRLYRVEIADTDKPAPQAYFKWSHDNGGLVGTGDFDSINKTVNMFGNKNAILYSGLKNFYLEALDYDQALGCWRVVYGAKASLANDHTLTLPDPVITPGDIFKGVIPPAPATGKRFFRLWNGIERVDDFKTKKDLPDNLGIQITFGPEGVGQFTPSDFWTFEARAGEIGNPLVLIPNLPPQGIVYHRVPLAEVHWTGNLVTGDDIEDCRYPFQPLTKLSTCCTYRVGDGIHSHGDFTSVQAAVNALPAKGGVVCVLNGIYDESIVIEKRVGIRIHGCGPSTRIRAISTNQIPQPAFMIRNSDAVALEDMAIEAGPRSAVQIDNARHVAVRCCVAQMRDLPTIWQAIYSRGDDVVIENNIIEVLPREGGPPMPSIPPELGSSAAPAGVNTAPDFVNVGFATRGGIQLAGGSDRVRISDNVIQGGIWNGITLGSLVKVGAEGEDVPDNPDRTDPCDPCKPVDTTDDEDPQGGPPKFFSTGDLYDIEISRNRITDMGINGIGVVRFFDLLNRGDLIGVHNLHIYDNFISRCMRRDIAKVRKSMEWLVAYGGIALAKVSDLRILRNEIINNGPSHRVPICGVYAIIVQGLQLDDNRIINNGHRSKEPTDSLQVGIRGGVHVWIVLPTTTISTQPTPSLAASNAAAAGSSQLALRDGVTTVAMRDNIVVAPVGRALTCFALGPVVVARNRLVTQGTTSKGLDLLATTTLLGNLGISNEWTLGLLLILILKLAGKLPDTLKDKECELAKTFGLLNVFTKPPSIWPPLMRKWNTGKTLFTDNQVTLDVVEEPVAFALSSIAVCSLDDLGFTDNQCEINSTNFFVWTDVALGAGSVRVADNRFSETWLRALFSGLSIGGMNTTTDNQATHCLRAEALLPNNMLVFKDNLSLVEAFCPGLCSRRQGTAQPADPATPATGVPS